MAGDDLNRRREFIEQVERFNRKMDEEINDCSKHVSSMGQVQLQPQSHREVLRQAIITRPQSITVQFLFEFAAKRKLKLEWELHHSDKKMFGCSMSMADEEGEFLTAIACAS